MGQVIPEMYKSASQVWVSRQIEESVIHPLEELTYAELVSRRDASKLIPGVEYRITDFVTTVGTSFKYGVGATSAAHAFDIVVVADSVSSLNEDARACLHEGDTYFEGCDLPAWELKYCLDNDINRFAWANTSEAGKGVVYHMVDEWGNEAGYDFKNILFAEGEGASLAHCYTFGMNVDDSLKGGSIGNIIKPALNTRGVRYLCHSLFSVACINNIIDYDCHVSFGLQCMNNFVGKLSTVSLGIGSKFNIIGSYSSVTCGTYCFYNTIGNESICTFGDGNSCNKVGDSSGVELCGQMNKNITVGDNCTAIKIGFENDEGYGEGACTGVKIGDNCSRISIGYNALYVEIEADCSDIVAYLGGYDIKIGQSCMNITMTATTPGEDCVGLRFHGSNNEITIDGLNYGSEFLEGVSQVSLSSGCSMNHFGLGVRNITLHDGCSRNIFETGCYDIVLGENADGNTFGIGCNEITLGAQAGNNAFGNGCSLITFVDGDDEHLSYVRNNVMLNCAGVTVKSINTTSDDGSFENNEFKWLIYPSIIEVDYKEDLSRLNMRTFVPSTSEVITVENYGTPM